MSPRRLGSRSRTRRGAQPQSEGYELRTLGVARGQPNTHHVENVSEGVDGDQGREHRGDDAQARRRFPLKCPSNPWFLRTLGIIFVALIAVSVYFLIIKLQNDIPSYQHEWFSIISQGQDGVNITTHMSASQENDTSRQFCDRHIVEGCQIRYFNQHDSDITIQDGRVLLCVESGPNNSQGCLCLVEDLNIATDRCSTVYLQHSATQRLGTSCPKKVPENLDLQFSCQIRKADNGTERSCKCLEAQESRMKDYLQRNNNPFIKDSHQPSATEFRQQEPEQMPYLPPDEIEIYSSKPTMSSTTTSTHTVTTPIKTTTITLDTISPVHSHMSSAIIPGFYVMPSSLSSEKSVEVCNENSKGPKRGIPLIERVALQTGYLRGILPQLGQIQMSLRSRALGWKKVEYQNCMQNACDQTEYGKIPDKNCSNNSTNMDKLMKQNCKMCSPVNLQMLTEHCEELVIKEQATLYTVYGMAVLSILVALGLVALRRRRRLQGMRELEGKIVQEKSHGTDTQRPWDRFFRKYRARKVSGSGQVDTETNPSKPKKRKLSANGASAMHEKVPIIPPAHVRNLSLDGVGTNYHRKSDTNTTTAIRPIIPHIRITSTGSQSGRSDIAFQRKSFHTSDRPELPGGDPPNNSKTT